MIRKTLATTLVAGAALTGLAPAAHAAAAPVPPKPKSFEVCGKGELGKNGKCVKRAKQKVTGAVTFGSSARVSGEATNKTRSTMDVVVTFYWKATGNRSLRRTIPVKAGKTDFRIGTAIPAHRKMMQKVTVQICKGPKTKRECGVLKTVRP
ncbi:hypothetical protein GCM10009678_36240 [Actinomadura kijaniata]|uniref:Uncharacterized protein n=1 Tax=Actinomadura namibiensis TaxID=182080 RepID=A0A7W3LQ99_ACTNM|nr:hypothetical protein [Actinomadura namibiensis]MBA8952200.1 hypothetical protein [Actinomadura namibiensis]